eukprot:TRINITY_DN42822_c0_g1_i1.p1 TRINITY_DN42822_c0_g1~~TRINITY_DN42822_c0_g1_i1.p1  ORF type:complete len:307 (+),score=50.92 TRINITY_DN42822_c0_g1_i1:48-968(+)
MMRRSRCLLVVYQPVKDIEIPDRAPEIPKTRFIRGRMQQMRQSIGMSPSEIDALIKHDEGQSPPSEPLVRDPNLPDEPIPTWADIVQQRERAGQLYSPKTIQDTFPYMNGQPRGVPDFKDAFREEQLLAHLDADSNHPMTVYGKVISNRLAFIGKSILSFFLGMWIMKAYLSEAKKTELQPVEFMRENFAITEDEAVRRVSQGKEELVPILQNTRAGTTVVWLPISKASHMMWNERPGVNYAAQVNVPMERFLGQAVDMNYNQYSYPGSLAGLVDTPDSQIEWQKYSADERHAIHSLYESMVPADD